MTTDTNQILIFKTNIQTEFEKVRIQAVLDADEKIHCWNIDQQDVDCVLRIKTDKLTVLQIISIINGQGFDCAELE